MAGDLGVALRALYAGRECPLVVGGHIPLHAPFLTGLAGLAFAYDGQRRRLGGVKHFNQGLETHGIGQPGFERRHVHDPVQGVSAGLGGVKCDLGTTVVVYLHAQDRCRVLIIGPAADGF